jgi:hypothetical protein
MASLVYILSIFHQINPKLLNFLKKTCVFKKPAGFSFEKPQVLLKKPAG